MMKKLRMLLVITIMTSIGISTLCYADTVAVPYDSSNTITQTGVPNDGTYKRTDIIYAPGAGANYESIYANGLTGDSIINVNGTEYTQITTTYGNTGMATVTVNPVRPGGVPSDMDAYQMAYISSLQSYGLTIDPVTGQIVSVSQ